MANLMSDSIPASEKRREQADSPRETDSGATKWPEVESLPPARRNFPIWLDIAVVLVLFLSALPIRWSYTRGDLWLDEADYAFAAVRGFQANRWDTPDSPAEPEKLVRLRHYHPPLVSHVMGAALRFGPEDRTLRFPFVVAGGLTVSLLYLCGVSLFGQVGLRRHRQSVGNSGEAAACRAIAFACALVLLYTPAHLRASSHALPWAFITLWLLAILWTLLKLAEFSRPSWLAGTGAALGALFITSEYVVPALIAVGIALPLIAWPRLRRPHARRRLAISAAGGAVLFLLIVFIFWPAGLTGGLIKMLRHYMMMANDPWPVTIHGVNYTRAPKTAYLLWYWDLFKPYFVFCALGLAGMAALIAVGRGRRILLATLAYTGVVLAAAHKSHIIGPEYLIHALPLLTLIGGLFFLLLAQVQRMIGAVAAIVAGCVVAMRSDPSALSGMDVRSRHPRWPEAARYIKSRWKPDDRMLAPSYGSVGRWYVLHVAGIDAREWQVMGLPLASERAGDRLIGDIRHGVYRFVAAGSTFADTVSVNPRVLSEIRAWKIAWRSDEGKGLPSRLTIYERSQGVNSIELK